MSGCASDKENPNLYTEYLSFHQINQNFKTVMIPNISKGLGINHMMLSPKLAKRSCEGQFDNMHHFITLCITHKNMNHTSDSNAHIIQQATPNIKEKALETLTEIYMKNVTAIPFIIVKKLEKISVLKIKNMIK